MRPALLLVLALSACPRPAPSALDAGSPITRESSGGGTAGDFFTFTGGRRVQALDCGLEDGGAWCIERAGPGQQRVLVHYRWRGAQLLGDLDHLADAGDAPCVQVALAQPTDVYELPSRRVSSSRLDGQRLVAGDGRPVAHLDAGVDARVVERAMDADGQPWLELAEPVSGWVPLDCPRD